MITVPWYIIIVSSDVGVAWKTIFLSTRWGSKKGVCFMIDVIDLMKQFIGLMKICLYFLIISKIKEILDLIIKK